MRLLLHRTLILLTVIVLIAAPAFVTANAAIQRADAALVDARPLDAVADYQYAKALLFWRADLQERAGRAAFVGGDMSTAVRLLEQAPNLSADGWKDLGKAYFQLGLYDQSVKALQRGLAFYSANTSMYRELSLAYNALGDYESEAAALQKYVALDDTDAATRHRLGLLLSIFDPEKALPELMASAKLDESYDPEVQTMRSTINLSMLETDESKRLMVIGRGLGLLEEWQLARIAFQRAVDLGQGNAEAWAWLGEAKQHLGQDGGDELARAVTIDPFSANVRALYGLYWKRKNEPQKALAQFQWAAVIQPENSAFQAALGDAYAFAGDLPSALAAYQLAAEITPTDVSYWRMLALFCAQYSFQVEDVGIPAAQQVLALAPGEASSFDLLGWTYLASNNTTLAEANLTAALQADYNYAPAQLHLGMMYLQMDKMDEAHSHLMQAQVLDPDGADGQAAAKLLDLYFH